jgi:hypothetical protein
MKKLVLILAVVLSAAGSAIAQGNSPVDVSIIQLISTPERYDQKLVRVSGFLWLEFEGNALYLHKEDKEHMLFKNGLWINVEGDQSDIAHGLSGEYVIVEAMFDAKSKGHLGLWSGTLKRVKRIAGLKL